jgi:hypothetical protein
MNATALTDNYIHLSESQQAIVATLALVGPTPGKTRLLEYLREARFKSDAGIVYTSVTIEPVLAGLQIAGWIDKSPDNDLLCAKSAQTVALKTALRQDNFDRICSAVDSVARVNFTHGTVFPRNYRNAVMLLRMALLRGRTQTEVQACLDACAEHFDFYQAPPYLDMFGRPFDASFLALLQPWAQETILTTLLPDGLASLTAVAPLMTTAKQLLDLPGEHNRRLLTLYAQHSVLCGQLESAQALVEPLGVAFGPAMQGALALFKNNVPEAAATFEVALKQMRQETGRASSVFPGLLGYLLVLALLRSGDARLLKKAQSYLTHGMRAQAADVGVYANLNYLAQVQSSTRQLGDNNRPMPASAPLQLLLEGLVDFWLGADKSELQSLKLAELCLKSEAAGFDFIAAQAAELLGRGAGENSAEFAQRARTLHDKMGIAPLADWFEKQEAWQRQLDALAKLSTSSSATANPSRLIWELTQSARHIGLAPREQKRKGKTGWTAGRAVALKRLSEDATSIDFLTAQDRQVCSAIRKENFGYYGSVAYDIDVNAALPLLIGHPLVFTDATQGIRVEIVRGEPELEIKKTAANTLTLRLQPDLASASDNVVVVKETPTRLRVIQITDEHRRIAAILGHSLKVPERAKTQVLEAIRAISSLITIQSDLDVLPSNLPQVEADARIHVHLMPHGDGLRTTLLVRPFASAGPYYAPGAGSESVIAEIDGKALQARRHLAQEGSAAQALVAACPVLRDSELTHGERLVEDPEACLELLLQLQSQADKVNIAWPEGEKFKVTRELGESRFSMSIKREVDWFAASGELKLDDEQVIDLQKLLELTAASHGRFINLGDNQFLALTDAFRRRLDALRAYAHRQGKGVRVHRLAAGALQELAEAAGKVKTDKHWKEHLARLSALDSFAPVLPATLQAELRDYQLAGFNWLSRLAHWGVGACLADDMGLGKTLQALALLLSRAPNGPALVVAPTSVCLNWLAEIDRFAPTLNVRVFGSGNRVQTLAGLQPFDLVIVSYGLLQQEAERFAAVPWHTVVLDEAQAIKNHQTKRSQAAMALQGDFKMLCSGTPLENHLGEMWNLFRFINPGLLGSLEDFNERFAGPIERLQNAPAKERLRQLIRPFMLRRTKSQVLSELPSRTEILRQVEPSAEESALYEALRRAALARLASSELEAGQRQLQILAEIMKLRRACCNPSLVAPELALPSSKLAAFGELLDELLANHHKALVFSQFVDHLGLIRQELEARGVRYQYLDGSTPMQERQARVNAFQAGDGDVFLISLKAGGTGLNLTAADYVIHMDPWWNPAVEDQASDRAHRIGQTRPVTIYRLVVKDTIEEKIVDLHKTKRALADSLLEGAELGAKLSADDMLALLQDEWQAT